MLAQAGLEDYFQQKQELAEQLDIVLQDVLSGINKKLTSGNTQIGVRGEICDGRGRHLSAHALGCKAPKHQ